MINIQNLTYAYLGVDAGNNAVNDISLHIAPLESVGIIGSNGSGKSTLLKLLCGIILPDEGKITIDGVNVSKKTLADIRQRVGFVFQNPDDQLFMSSVYEDIAFGLRNQGDNDAQVDEKVQHILESLDIAHLAKRAPFRLSGGEKRTVSMACVLAMSPSVMLFDEPTAFLDQKARRKFINMVQGLSTTNVIVSHDFQLIIELCDRVVILHEGKIVGDGVPETLLFDDRLMAAAELETPDFTCFHKKKLTC